jgi:hypothetical protein
MENWNVLCSENYRIFYVTPNLSTLSKKEPNKQSIENYMPAIKVTKKVAAERTTATKAVGKAPVKKTKHQNKLRKRQPQPS